jgi:hypothetical protein
MPFSPVRIPQTDDPTHVATIGINANQHPAIDLTNGYRPPFPVIPPVIDLVNHEAAEQFDCQPEW